MIQACMRLSADAGGLHLMNTLLINTIINGECVAEMKNYRIRALIWWLQIRLITFQKAENGNGITVLNCMAWEATGTRSCWNGMISHLNPIWPLRWPGLRRPGESWNRLALCGFLVHITILAWSMLLARCSELRSSMKSYGIKEMRSRIWRGED